MLPLSFLLYSFPSSSCFLLLFFPIFSPPPPVFCHHRFCNITNCVVVNFKNIELHSMFLQVLKIEDFVLFFISLSFWCLGWAILTGSPILNCILPLCLPLDIWGEGLKWFGIKPLWSTFHLYGQDRTSRSNEVEAMVCFIFHKLNILLGLPCHACYLPRTRAVLRKSVTCYSTFWQNKQSLKQVLWCKCNTSTIQCKHILYKSIPLLTVLSSYNMSASGSKVFCLVASFNL